MIDFYINKKREKEKKSKERDNFIFGLCLGLFIMIFALIRYMNSSYDTSHDKRNFDIFIIGVIVFVLAVIYPNIFSLLKKVLSPIVNILGKILSNLVLAIVYFIIICPVGIITRKKYNKKSNDKSTLIDYEYNNDLINNNKKSFFYQILKVFKFFFNEKYFIFLPVLIILIILSIILVLVNSSVIAPMIYTLF